MATKEFIKKIKTVLQTGDYKKIAKLSGVNISTINNLFNNREESVLEDTQSLILENALILIEDRKKKEATLEEKAISLL